VWEVGLDHPHGYPFREHRDLVEDHEETRKSVCGKARRLYRPVRGLVRTVHA
jgi:hypothetical protein